MILSTNLEKIVNSKMAQASPGHVGRWTCKLKSAQTSANLRIEPGEKKKCPFVP